MQAANFYGRVVQIKPPRPTRGTGISNMCFPSSYSHDSYLDFVMSVVVTDETVAGREDANGSEPSGIVINIFRPNLNDFPQTSESTCNQDYLQLRHFRIQNYQSQFQALSTHWSAWTVFRRDKKGQWVALPERAVSPAEIESLNGLDRALKDGNGRLSMTEHSVASSLSPEKKKRARVQRTIAQVTEDYDEAGYYFDLLAEVQDSLPDRSNGQQCLYLADYSAQHQEPFLVSFWDNFAEDTEEYRAGDLIYITGLHAQRVDGRIMAALHGNDKAGASSRSMKKVPLRSTTAQDLLRRKERMEEGLLADKHASMASLKTKVKKELLMESPVRKSSRTPTKAEASESPNKKTLKNDESQVKKTPLKSSPLKQTSPLKGMSPMKTFGATQLLSESPLKRKSLPKTVESEKSPITARQSSTKAPKSPVKEKTLEKASTSVAKPSASLARPSKTPTVPKPFNQAPTTVFWQGVPPTSIAQILAHPARNFKFIVKGHVTGHNPPTLTQFARPQCAKCQRSWIEISRITCYCGEPWKDSFGWVFQLTVTDDTGHIDLTFCFEDALEFLGGLQPIHLPGDEERTNRIGLILHMLESAEAQYCISSYEINRARRYRVSATRIAF